MTPETEKEFNTFIEDWNEPSNKNKDCFLHFKEQLGKMEGVTLDFISRPGITYSLRAVHNHQVDKELFVMIDVIEDVSRWLSICFYGEMITDPDERGDRVPEGLLGDDAICFDLEEHDETLVRYIEKRLDEASLQAAGRVEATPCS